MPKSRDVSPFDLPRWTEDEAREVLGALERSGQAVSVFAAEHGVDPQRVYLWRRRLGAGAERSTFRELVVRAAESSDGASERFEVVLASGTIIRVPAGFDGDALRRLLELLSRVDAC